MTDAVKERYYSIRQHLAAMNYPTNFGADSLDLVEKIFTDLVATTESYKQVQDKEAALGKIDVHCIMLFSLQFTTSTP